MNVFLVFISCFVLWGILLGIPYLVAKKVNTKVLARYKEVRNIVPPEAYVHSVFLYTVVIFIFSNLMFLVKDAGAQHVYKVLIAALLTAFTYQTLRLFRK